MSVAVTCQCKTTFELKDEYAGRMVKCPNCGAEQRAPGTKLTPKSQADPIFDRDVFLLRQKAMAINEKYAVSDEKGEQILFVERPRYFLRNLLALFVALAAGAVVFIGAGVGGTALRKAGWEGTSTAVEWLGLIGAWVVLILIAVALSKKRHITFYRGKQKGEKVLEVRQWKKMEFFTTTFIIRDAKNTPLGRLRKNNFSNLLRKKWRLMTFGGRDILVAKEDSMILSLLRRLLGPMFGLLRTNYVFEDGSGKHVGEFQRKMTILDRYALDMRADLNRNIDRRLALALGVVLDTGERR
jgi:uncharacterized protein YxjI